MRGTGPGSCGKVLDSGGAAASVGLVPGNDACGSIVIATEGELS